MKPRFTAWLLLLALPLATLAQDSYRFENIGRVVAIADIHGAYEPLLALLRGSAVVDEALRWSGGATHLVIVGDVLDRGDDSKQALDLLLRLETEAQAAGGAVHLLLGNHEIMNLTGQLAYVTRGEFAAYDEFETNSMRRAAQSRFEDRAPGLSGLALRSAFSRQYPRGFFGHHAAFAPAGPYGSWLLTKPVLLVINDTAFVHAGLPARLLEGGLAAINTEARQVLGDYVAAMRVLEDAGLLFPETDFGEHSAIARRFLANSRAEADAPVRAAAQTLLDLHERDPLGSDGPVWYRGMVDCSPALEAGRLQALLDTLGVSRLVIGHTPTRDHRVQQRFDGRLLMSDTGMLADYYGGQPAALIFENDTVRLYYPNTGEPTRAQPMPRLVGARPLALGDEELALLLGEAELLSSAPAGDSLYRLRLRHAGRKLDFDALFSAARVSANGELFLPEVAAYRLDRLLGMDLVPVAVAVELEGLGTGALYLDQDAFDGQTATAPGAEPWCPIADQQRLGELFDFLLHTRDRDPTTVRYMNGNGKLVFAHRRDLFAPGAPPVAGPEMLEILNPALRASFEALTQAQLEEQLGTVLDAARRDGILRRRDALLTLPAR